MDYFSNLFNEIGQSYSNKYNFYGDICAQIKEIIKNDINELTVINYLYDYNSLLNRLKCFHEFIQKGLSFSTQDNIQVDILNNLLKQCNNEIMLCETIINEIKAISLTDIFKDYIPIFEEINSNKDIPYIQHYAEIIDKIKIKKRCKEILISKIIEITKLQAKRIKEIIDNQNEILDILDKLDKDKTMKMMMSYFEMLSSSYIEKTLKDISNIHTLLLEKYLVESFDKIYESLLKSFIEKINPNVELTNLGMIKDRLYLFNDGSHNYNDKCKLTRKTICYYMMPITEKGEERKLIKKYVKDVKIKKLKTNGNSTFVYYI